MTLAACSAQTTEATDQALTSHREVIECARMVLLPVEGKRILIPRLAKAILLATNRHILEGSGCFLYVLRRHIVQLSLRLMAIETRFILRLPRVMLLHLILVHLLHSLGLEIIHRLPAMKRLLGLILLETVDVRLLLELDLLLVALNYYVGPVSADQDLGGHA